MRSRPFPIYRCENRLDMCCQVPWGYGPPRTFAFPTYTAEKRVWHDEVTCYCEAGYCTARAHRQTLKWEKGEVVHTSPEKAKTVKGKCVKRTKGMECKEGGEGEGGEECGSYWHPYNHLILYGMDTIFERGAHAQRSFIMDSPGFDFPRDQVIMIRSGSASVLSQALDEHECILSLSYFGHSWVGNLRGLSSSEVSQLSARNFVNCPGCVTPAQIMLYGCRCMLGPHAKGQPGAGGDPDAVNSIGGAFARHFMTSAYGATGGSTYGRLPKGGASDWPYITNDPMEPENWFDGARWVRLFGRSLAVDSGRRARPGRVVSRP